MEGARTTADGGGEPTHPGVQPAAAGQGGGPHGAAEEAGGGHGYCAAAGQLEERQCVSLCSERKAVIVYTCRFLMYMFPFLLQLSEQISRKQADAEEMDR